MTLILGALVIVIYPASLAVEATPLFADQRGEALCCCFITNC